MPCLSSQNVSNAVSLLPSLACCPALGSHVRDHCAGVVPEGTILVTSQFNLASICQWHSPGDVPGLLLPTAAEETCGLEGVLLTLFTDIPLVRVACCFGDNLACCLQRLSRCRSPRRAT